LIIGIGIITWLFSGLITNLNYDIVLATGVLFWVLCILAIHQIKLAVEKNDPAIIHRTIISFFIINALVSLFVYAGIVLETGTLNPYLYQGNYQKYFINTGDYIKGVFFDTSSTNAVFNAFAVIYLLQKNKFLGAIGSMFILLLCGSNMINILLGSIFIFLFIFRSSKDQKSMIIVCMLMLIFFLVKISPQNNQYITETWQKITGTVPPPKPVITKIIPITEKPDSILNGEELKQKIAQLYVDSVNRLFVEKNTATVVDLKLPDSVMTITGKPEIPRSNIHTPPFQHKWDTTVLQKKLMLFTEKEKLPVPVDQVKEKKLPGKLIALKQTVNYFKQHPARVFTGTGPGNFSSKLAFRATALKIGGGYPDKYVYINPDFKKNHLDLYLYYFAKSDTLHSLTNTPNSVYDQLLSEYGLLGLVSFIFFYLGYFASRYSDLSYGIPLLLLMAGLFFTDYWFEQLSVVVLFELLLLLNIKETANKIYNDKHA
jgi:hypothetical protein